MQSFSMASASINLALSSSALEHIKQSLHKRGRGCGVRLNVYRAGCSGYAYKLEFADAVKPADSAYSQDGVTVFVPADAASILEGTEIDYRTEGANSGLVFKNPNAVGECGCGESFYID